MEISLIIIGSIIVAGIIIIIGLLLKRPSPHAADPGKDHKIGELEEALKKAEGEKNELIGKNKELFAQHERLKAKFEAQDKECKDLQKKVTKFETNEEQQKKAEEKKLGDLENSRKAFEDAEKRVNDEALAKRQMEEEERDRLWAEHENNVISNMLDMCKQPQYQFTCYTNKTLPEEFDGSLKPDFLIEFLDQYVIFDAKVSKAQSLQGYIDEAVKKTADKVRKNKKIYPHIFLVVPTEAISELKRVVYPKDELMFYVVSREALAPILASLKRISTYELAEQLDPQKRENIINILAELVTHISYRNAHELILTRMGAETVERAAHLDPDIALEVEQKQSEKKMMQLPPSEIKRLVSSITEQKLAASQLASPKAAVKKSFIESAQSVISQKLL